MRLTKKKVSRENENLLKKMATSIKDELLGNTRLSKQNVNWRNRLDLLWAEGLG